MTTLLNPLAAVETTLDKHYLTRLKALGVAIPKTRFLEPEGEVPWVAPSEEWRSS